MLKKEDAIWRRVETRDGMLRWGCVHLCSFFSLHAAQVKCGEKSNLNISYAQPSGAFTPLWVAREEGLFKKQALDVSFE
jgi:ABC-type nitrate/sulfonate/bicarbonate transport system substrate-binding protein